MAQGNMTVDLETGTHTLELVLVGDATCAEHTLLPCWHICGTDHMKFLPMGIYSGGILSRDEVGVVVTVIVVG